MPEILPQSVGQAQGTSTPTTSASSRETTADYGVHAQAIIGKVPPALVRWGLTCWLCLLLLLIGISWFIKYPDLVAAPMVLRNLSGPRAVSAKIGGTVDKMWVKEGQRVTPLIPLLSLETNADLQIVAALTQWANRMNQALITGRDLPTHAEPEFASLAQSGLGEVQTDLETFGRVYHQYLAATQGLLFVKRRKALTDELIYLQQAEQALGRQQQIRKQELALAERDFETQRYLYSQKVIPSAELSRENAKVLAKRLVPEQVAEGIIANRSQQAAKGAELVELDKVAAEQRDIFWSGLNSFRSALARWQQQYVLVAPLAGTVRFAAFVQTKEAVQAGQPLVYIVPEASATFGEASVAQANLGKVHPGQPVVVKFHSFPFEQYGIVTGRVSFLAKVPNPDGSFQVRVEFPQGLVFSDGSALPARVGMQGTAEIVTDQARLLERLLRRMKGTGR